LRGSPLGWSFSLRIQGLLSTSEKSEWDLIAQENLNNRGNSNNKKSMYWKQHAMCQMGALRNPINICQITVSQPPEQLPGNTPEN